MSTRCRWTALDEPARFLWTVWTVGTCRCSITMCTETSRISSCLVTDFSPGWSDSFHASSSWRFWTSSSPLSLRFVGHVSLVRCQTKPWDNLHLLYAQNLQRDFRNFDDLILPCVPSLIHDLFNDSFHVYVPLSVINLHCSSWLVGLSWWDSFSILSCAAWCGLDRFLGRRPSHVLMVVVTVLRYHECLKEDLLIKVFLWCVRATHGLPFRATLVWLFACAWSYRLVSLWWTRVWTSVDHAPVLQFAIMPLFCSFCGELKIWTLQIPNNNLQLWMLTFLVAFILFIIYNHHEFCSFWSKVPCFSSNFQTTGKYSVWKDWQFGRRKVGVCLWSWFCLWFQL